MALVKPPGLRRGDIGSSALMTRAAFFVSVLLGVGCLAFAYANAGLEQVSRLLLIFGALWLLAGWRGWNWLSSLSFLSLLALSGFGLWIGLPPAWMLAGALGGLFALDLADFMRRMRFALKKQALEQYDELKSVERSHLIRLALVALMGILLTGLLALVR